MKNRIAIFFSTSDGYKDCWEPFFCLFEKYWPDFNGTIYISSEFEDYSHGNLNIKSLKVSQKHNVDRDNQPSWGKRMRWAIEKIEEDIFLFLQEDYFLKGKVSNSRIMDIVTFMNENPDVKCCHITNTSLKVQNSKYNGFSEVAYKQMYRINCQPAFWRKEEFMTILDENFSPWQFELLGSYVSARLKHLYLQVDTAALAKTPLYPYVNTGVIKGKWKHEVEGVFEENNIKVNYALRGFYETPNLVDHIKLSIKGHWMILKWRLFGRY